MAASSDCAIYLFLLAIALLPVSCLSLSNVPNSKQGGPFILPVGKDPKTNLFCSTIGIGTPQHNMDLVLDLGGPFLWYDCDKNYNSSSYRPFTSTTCDRQHCPISAGCNFCDGPFKPGCSNNTCSADIDGPIVGGGFSGDAGEDVFFISHTKVPRFISGCAESEKFGFAGGSVPLTGLPNTSKGVIGLANTKIALPTQLSSAFNLPNKFSLCLPSSNSKGLFGNLFIGGAPLSHNASNFLLTTPLVVNPVGTIPVSNSGDASYEYFIAVKSIKVGGKVLKFKRSLLSIDKKGNGGTKISTTDPFTRLHPKINKPLIREFVKRAAYKKIKKVTTPVAPFEACFDFSTIGRSTSTGLLDVPSIDLVLQGGHQWTIHGDNSLVLVNKNVACLGFVNAGEVAATSIVIGGHQLEDNLLVFDLVSSTLGFSSSLLLHNLRCSSITS